MIMLTAGQSKATVAPEMGGGLAGLWAGGLPVLRPWSGRIEDGPFALACNLLVPFSNRISRGGFEVDGQFHTIEPNLPGEPFPLHGDGFLRPWSVVRSSDSMADLSLIDGRIGPFQYTAQVSYRLSPEALEIRLAVTHLGDRSLPYGLGLHPWFPRSAATRLQFAATGEWPETDWHLPASNYPQPHRGEWKTPSPLPEGWINMGFSGWDGNVQIDQGPKAMSVRMTTPGVSNVILYSPSGTSDFFCCEPVTHPVDAHNLPGRQGLASLDKGESLSVTVSLLWGYAA